MAADKPNLVLLHLEKGVLGICILFLLFSLFHWVAGSPREFEGPNNQMLAPSQLDDAIRKYAEKVRSENEAYKPSERKVPEYAKVIDSWINTPPRVEVKALVEFQPPLATPPYVPQVIIPERVKLANIKAVAEGMKPTTPAVWLGAELPKVAPLQDGVAAHGKITFPASTLGRHWRELLKKTMLSQWTLALIKVEVEVKETLADGTALPVRQLVLTPASQPASAPVANVQDPAAAAATPAAGAASPAAVPTVQLDALTYEGKKIEVNPAADAWVTQRQPPLIHPDYPDVYFDGKWASWKERVKSPYSQFSPGAFDLTVAPETGDVVVWFHDAKLNAESKYSYRLRLAFLNPAFGSPDVLDNEESAGVKEVFTQWSDWSAPGYVVFSSSYEMVGRGGKSAAKVKVSTEFLGQNLSHVFLVAAGQAIGGEVMMTVTDVLENKKVSRPVMFFTGAALVDTNDIKVLRAADPTKLSPGGFEAIYLGSDNRLRTFIDRPR